MQLYTTAAIRELETQASLAGHSPWDLMQRAGEAAFCRLKSRWPHAKKIGVFTGRGNNGGDGYVLAHLAHRYGLQVHIRAVGDHSRLPYPADRARQACQQSGVPIAAYPTGESLSADVVVDALLGIGLKSAVQGVYASAIQAMQGMGAPILALDTPSGLHADTGHVGGVAVRAAETISFIGMKRGLLTGAATAYGGKLTVDSLGLEDILAKTAPTCHTIAADACHLPKRAKDAHKGHFGHVCILGGNHGFAGAALLAGKAALCVGAGLVSVITRPQHVAGMLAACPELMCHGVDNPTDAKVDALFAKASVLVVGPGLGEDAWGAALYQKARAFCGPKVTDASALAFLAKQPVHCNMQIITPHPKEASVLLGTTTANIQANRFEAACKLQKRYGGTVVLKGSGTLVQTPGQTHVCTKGNPGMAKGGSGDVLSGIIAGLVAGGLRLSQAAIRGVYLHALAADQAAAKTGEWGLLASDIIAGLPGVMG